MWIVRFTLWTRTDFFKLCSNSLKGKEENNLLPKKAKVKNKHKKKSILEREFFF